MPPASVFELHPTVTSHGKLHEATVNGSLTRWWEYGDSTAETLVLIHGFRGDHHGLELLAQGLLDYRVLIPDLPGFGRSEPMPAAEHTVSTYAAWLAEFLRLTGQNPIHLVGHSFGSIVSSYLTATRPHLVQRLTLINPICEPALEGNQKLMSRLAEMYYAAGALLPAPLGFSLLKSHIITRISSEFMMKNSHAELRNFINGQHAAYFGAFSSRAAVLQAYRASISSTAAEFTPTIDLPIQMIVAQEDDLGSMEGQRAMFAALRRGRLDVIPEVGHLIHYETPLRAAALIADFHQEPIR